MQIIKIEIENFRLLKSFSIDLEDDLSLIIGKNNTGKTSVLTAMDRFLRPSDRNKIVSDDFNIDLKKYLLALIEGEKSIPEKDDYAPLGISLRVFIEYDEGDNLSLVSQLIMSLDPNDRNILLSFEYLISHKNILSMKSEYQSEKEKYNSDVALFFKEKQSEYFGPIKRKSLLSSDFTIFVDIVKEGINLNDVISFNYISAKRGVTNKENDKTLSSQTSKIYKKTSDSLGHNEAADQFKKKLRDTDKELSDIYDEMFDDLLEKVSKFGGLKKNDTDIKISSSLQHRELLEGNTTVLYSHDEHELPEHYNGLGYMNLISMIFEIEILLFQFKRSKKELPAAINLLFIEEPEAHTHPQMQYIFIKNIKNLLNESRRRDDGVLVHLQTIISTHSSHIVSECNFDDIKYLKKNIEGNGVSSKNLKNLKEKYSSLDSSEDEAQKKAYKFLKQYLTLNRSELFFADKAIFVEGETERILIPAMMKKIDQRGVGDNETPLLSQNISIVEVGAHSQTFEKFIDFIGVKVLIITDIDSYYEENSTENEGIKIKTCTPDDDNAKKTSNQSLLFFYGKERSDLEYFTNLGPDKKILSEKNGKWIPDKNGRVMLCYQTAEEGYYARSFEDSFFSINKSLLGTDANAYPSLTKKWFNKYVVAEHGIPPLEFSEKSVGSKPSLAMEILLNSQSSDGHEFVNWEVPAYIVEGLEWLRKD